jgi:hypothetical protein
VILSQGLSLIMMWSKISVLEKGSVGVFGVSKPQVFLIDISMRI